MRQDLIRKLSELQARQVSLDNVELWLVSHLQQILQGQDEELKHLADRLDALFIQSGEGVVTEPELDAEIEGIIRNLSTVYERSIFVSSGSLLEGSADDRAQTVSGPIGL